MTSWLYRSEARGIQGWILADGRLRGLTGGSQRIVGLRAAIERHATQVGGASVLSASAGGAVVRLHDRSALERFAATWPAVVGSAEHCPGLELVHAWVPEAEGVSKLFEAAARARVPRSVNLPVATPITERSGRTGGAAVARSHRKLMDAPSLARQTAQGRDALLDALRAAMGEVGTRTDFVGADVDRLAGQHAIAIVHADGDGIGRWLVNNSARWGGDPTAFQTFSRTLSEATTAAAGRAVAQVASSPSMTARELPIRPVVLGGDDLTLICAAPLALELAQAFMAFFAEETQNRGLADGRGFTASAGIAWVHAHFPFHRAHELAESLCRWAKSTGPERLAFHRLTSSLHEEHWEDVLDGELSGADGCRLTAGPYTLAQLNQLDQLQGSLADMPRGPLRQWLSRLKEDRTAADLAWQRLQEVAQGPRSDHDWDSFAQALDALGAQPSTGLRPASDTPAATPIGDALELIAVSTSRTAASQSGEDA